MWIKANGRTFPQKWPGDVPSGCTHALAEESKRPGFGAVVGGPFSITDAESMLPLNELARRYPLPSHSGEVLPP